ncbi:hypothetical protein CLV78_101814 [Aliiruegeria haliotis]|uniref:Uncharacterized protein n=1 Tax=Aliiruegeria haliotis TaxID=1280846 RepID=A0A2T0S089_9RHOB|nr:hypothetical protein [Aliiruegeria haliotis]PRY26713.1 hypothetical protein CLV78_101814 [Aliiruegeria haliotis]
MFGPHWLFRMRRWVHSPPSTRRVLIVLVAVGLCVALYALEHFGFWPEGLTADRAPHRLRF